MQNQETTPALIYPERCPRIHQPERRPVPRDVFSRAVRFFTRTLPIYFGPSNSQVLRPRTRFGVSNRGSGSSIASPRSVWVVQINSFLPWPLQLWDYKLVAGIHPSQRIGAPPTLRPKRSTCTQFFVSPVVPHRPAENSRSVSLD